MRIISGIYGGRRIKPPSKMPWTRPTTDIAKEGLFNILGNRFEISGKRSLDLFGGTGCISYELASRGGIEQIVVEKDNHMASFIQKTALELGISNLKLIKMDVFKYLDKCTESFDIIFAGPPYALDTIDQLPVLIESQRLLKPGGWFILEHTPRNNYEKYPLFNFQRNYGSTIFSIFVNEAS